MKSDKQREEIINNDSDNQWITFFGGHLERLLCEARFVRQFEVGLKGHSGFQQVKIEKRGRRIF